MTARPETAQSNSPVTSHNSLDQCVSISLIGQPLAIAPSGDNDNVELIRVITTADSTHIETQPSFSSHNVSHNMRMPSTLSNFPETSRNNEVRLHQSDASLLIHMLPHNKFIRILKLLHGNQTLIIEDDARVDL